MKMTPKNELLEKLESLVLELPDTSVLFEIFESGDYLNVEESAFADEGVSVECKLCDFVEGFADSNLSGEDAWEIGEEHLLSEHIKDILWKEITKYIFQPAGNQKSLDEVAEK